jgi:hypothetical protein
MTDTIQQAGLTVSSQNTPSLDTDDYNLLDNKPIDDSAEAKRQRGLGDKNYLSYHTPWILYFYPNPKDDPNYILLDPEKDKESLNLIKNNILSIISFIVFIGILYSFWAAGSLFPALHTMWFFLWRYITLFIFFLCFSIAISLLLLFPFIIKKIKHYGMLTYDPVPYLKKYKWYNEKSKYVKSGWRGLYRFIFFLTTFAFVMLFIAIIPFTAFFTMGCGLLLGDLNRTYFAFGMAEYEVTELEKKSLQKRIEDKTGYSALKSFASDKLTKFGEKTGLTEGISKLRKATENPFLKYKLPDVPGLSSVKSLI